MNLFHWLTERFSKRGKALSRYHRGMARSKKRDHQGAIDDYTATIGMPDAPLDVKAMAFYKRALAHVAAGNDQKGTDDLDAVVAMDGSPMNTKTMARQQLVRMESRSRQSRS